MYPPLVAGFDQQITACNDTVLFTDHSSLNTGNIVSWDWDFGDGMHAGTSAVSHGFASGGSYPVKLTTVSQLGCSDTVTVNTGVPLIPRAAFVALTDSCHPEVTFINRSSLGATYQWRLGDSTTAISANLTHVYREEGGYEITLITGSESNCYDTATESIDYQQFEFLGHYIPNSFTPNGDGRNDVFTISGATICEEVELLIYDRWGRMVYQTKDLSAAWDGTSHGRDVAPGVYVYFLKGKEYSRKGTITVIR